MTWVNTVLETCTIYNIQLMNLIYTFLLHHLVENDSKPRYISILSHCRDRSIQNCERIMGIYDYDILYDIFLRGLKNLRVNFLNAVFQILLHDWSFLQYSLTLILCNVYTSKISKLIVFYVFFSDFYCYDKTKFLR